MKTARDSAPSLQRHATLTLHARHSARTPPMQLPTTAPSAVRSRTYQLDTQPLVTGNRHTVLAGHGDDAPTIVLQDALSWARAEAGGGDQAGGGAAWRGTAATGTCRRERRKKGQRPDGQDPSGTQRH